MSGSFKLFQALPNEILSIIFRMLSPFELLYLNWIAKHKNGTAKLQAILECNHTWSNPYFWPSVPEPQEEELYTRLKNSLKGVGQLGGSIPLTPKMVKEKHLKFRDSLNYAQLCLLTKIRPRTAILELPKKWQKDRLLMLTAIKHHPSAFTQIIKKLPELKSDEEIIRAAIQHSGLVIEHASNELKANKKVALAAVTVSGDALWCLPPGLRKDRDIAKNAVMNKGLALQYAKEFRDDEAIVIEAVRQDGNALKFASRRLKGNKVIVLEAVKKNGLNLRFATTLQNDGDVVREAVEQNINALKHASPELKGNEAFVLEIVKKDGWALQFASEELKDNSKVVTAALMPDINALQYASARLKGNKAIVLEAVKKAGRALSFASKEMQGVKEVVLAAVSQNYEVMRFASPALQSDGDIRLAAAKGCAFLLKECFGRIAGKYYPITSLDEFRKLAQIVVIYSPHWFHFLPEYLKHDKYFLLDCYDKSRGEHLLKIDPKLSGWIVSQCRLRSLYKDNQSGGKPSI